MASAATARKKQPGREGSAPTSAPTGYYFCQVPEAALLPIDPDDRSRRTILEDAVAPFAHLDRAEILVLLGTFALESHCRRLKEPLPVTPHKQYAKWYNQTPRNIRQACESLEKTGLMRGERTKRGYRYTTDWGNLGRIEPQPARKLKPKEEVDAEIENAAVDAVTYSVQCPKCGQEVGKLVSGEFDPAEDAILTPCHCDRKTTQPAVITNQPGDRNSSSYHKAGNEKSQRAGERNSSSYHKGEQKAKVGINGDPWLAVKKKLLGRIPETAYLNWFASTQGGPQAGDCLTVSVPNDATRVWLEEEYAELIAGALTEIGLPGSRVRYQVSLADAPETPPPPEPGLRQRLEALVPLRAVGDPLPDHLYKRIEERLGPTPWCYLQDVIEAKLHKIHSWALVADHLVLDARRAWERSGAK